MNGIGSTTTPSKLQLDGGRISVPVDEAIVLAKGILQRTGCDKTTALIVAEHLANANLCGVESHGLML